MFLSLRVYSSVKYNLCLHFRPFQIDSYHSNSVKFTREEKRKKKRKENFQVLIFFSKFYLYNVIFQCLIIKIYVIK